MYEDWIGFLQTYVAEIIHPTRHAKNYCLKSLHPCLKFLPKDNLVKHGNNLQAMGREL